MKIILAGVAFATLMVSPLFAQPQSTEGLPHSGAYQDQKKQLRIDYRDLDGSARKSSRPTSNPDLVKPWPCSSAPGFCPGYHGGNGG
jgi:hypothetical protein